MGKTLLRAIQGPLTALALMLSAGQAHALAVECAGCVAAADKTTSAVNEVKAVLDAILTELGEIKNHLTQIRLAVGPASTVATTGTLAQGADFRNLLELRPTMQGLELEKGVTFDFDDLAGLQENLNGILQIYTDAERLKEKVQGGKYWETVADVQKITERRRNVYRQSLERLISVSLYSLNQTGAAKSSELSLDQSRRGSLNLQAKANATAKTQGEILGRLNHLISLIAAQNALMGAERLKGLRREIDNVPAEPPAPNYYNVGGQQQ